MQVTVDYDSPSSGSHSSSPSSSSDIDILVAMKNAEAELKRETETAAKLRSQLKTSDSLDDLEVKKRALQIGIENKKAALQKIETEIHANEK